MRAPLSWLREYAALPEGMPARAVGDALVRVGLEVERVESGSDGLSGPIVLGRVLGIEELAEFKKPIRFCQVDVGEDAPRGIVCGARNFATGDLIVASLPGAMLPGGFAIAARTTYGRVSDGMICSVRELGIGEDHDGILVLPETAGAPGDDAVAALGLDDAVLDIAITPDRGYCLSIRGLAREAAVSLDVQFLDVASVFPPPQTLAAGYPVRIEDEARCPQFTVREITGLDRTAISPDWMVRRLGQAGLRSISLAVDVTNYVMLETGQPLHAFDRAKLTGTLVARRARPGETLLTLDGSRRALDPDDTVVADDSGPVALAGVMGGASTEIDAATTSIVLEAAHWEAAAIGRTVRRHKLPSEAAKRFERGVDPAIAGPALERAVDLLITFGGARVSGGATVAGPGLQRPSISLDVTLPSRVSGLSIDPATVARCLGAVGCETLEQFGPASAGPYPPLVGGAEVEILRVVPPTWRPDLTDPATLVEEVVRLIGYDQVPPSLPTPPPGRGLSGSQRLRRSVSRALASEGYVEVLTYPFVSAAAADDLGLAPGDARRRAVTIANPLADTEPDLRTSLLPGLLATLARNLGRGARDTALFETGLVFLRSPDAATAPRPSVDQRPTPQELAAIEAAIPVQPRHIATVAVGAGEAPGWWGPARALTWADAIESARVLARTAGVALRITPASMAPWHPGRCAALSLESAPDAIIGWAGELHPAVLERLGLPARTVAMELDLDALPIPEPAIAPAISPFPAALLDLALVVDVGASAQSVAQALSVGAGPLLESLRLFDVFVDADRLGAGRKSLAFALRLRAPDRTLTAEDAAAVRDGAVAKAAELTGAVLRS
jgi:phenylalanyl-tRNA synthetase beta chain